MFDQVAKAHLADLKASYKDETEPDELEDLSQLYFKQLYNGKVTVVEVGSLMLLDVFELLSLYTGLFMSS